MHFSPLECFQLCVTQKCIVYSVLDNSNLLNVLLVFKCFFKFHPCRLDRNSAIAIKPECSNKDPQLWIIDQEITEEHLHLSLH